MTTYSPAYDLGKLKHIATFKIDLVSAGRLEFLMLSYSRAD